MSDQEMMKSAEWDLFHAIKGVLRDSRQTTLAILDGKDYLDRAAHLLVTKAKEYLCAPLEDQIRELSSEAKVQRDGRAREQRRAEEAEHELEAWQIVVDVVSEKFSGGELSKSLPEFVAEKLRSIGGKPISSIDVAELSHAMGQENGLAEALRRNSSYPRETVLWRCHNCGQHYAAGHIPPKCCSVYGFSVDGPVIVLGEDNRSAVGRPDTETKTKSEALTPSEEGYLKRQGILWQDRNPGKLAEPAVEKQATIPKQPGPALTIKPLSAAEVKTLFNRWYASDIARGEAAKSVVHAMVMASDAQRAKVKPAEPITEAEWNQLYSDWITTCKSGESSKAQLWRMLRESFAGRVIPPLPSKEG